MNWLPVALNPLWLSCWSHRCSSWVLGLKDKLEPGGRERARQANSTGNRENPQAKPAFVLRQTCSPHRSHLNHKYIPTKCKARRCTLTASGGISPTLDWTKVILTGPLATEGWSWRKTRG